MTALRSPRILFLVSLTLLLGLTVSVSCMQTLVCPDVKPSVQPLPEQLYKAKQAAYAADTQAKQSQAAFDALLHQCVQIKGNTIDTCLNEAREAYFLAHESSKEHYEVANSLKPKARTGFSPIKSDYTVEIAVMIGGSFIIGGVVGHLIAKPFGINSIFESFTDIKQVLYKK